MLMTFPASCSNKLGRTIKVTNFCEFLTQNSSLKIPNGVLEKNPSEAEEMSCGDDTNDM